MVDLLEYSPQYKEVFGRSPQLSDIKPSAWAEKNIIIPGKGKLNYDFNPYCRKIIDTLAPDHPARNIAVMKGSQITFSSGVIMPALGYIIAEDPHNTSLMVGTPELVKMAVEKLDTMITGAELQDYIGYQNKRKVNNKTGDTDEIKYFVNGYVKTWSATNPKSVAQMDWERTFLDDYDAMKGQSKAAGSFQDLIEMRSAANMNTYKLMMISTPLLKATSNIEPAYLAGDRQRYFVECPCCHEPIIFKWTIPEGEVINVLKNDIALGQGGIQYETNNHGQVITKSVGYICYKCAGFFRDNNKQNMLREAVWDPTAVPVSDDYESYHISSLYAPVGMFNWAYYAKKHSQANKNGVVNEAKMQVLINTCWGETYSPQMEAPKANSIQRNCRDYYKPYTVPEQLSIKDGNGTIVILTCSVDMNGIMNDQKQDVRLDWEIKGWSEAGASYSIAHGSIGTFLRGRIASEDDPKRKKWTYEDNKDNSVWPELDKIIEGIYQTDTPSKDSPTNFRRMGIQLTGLDCGHFTTYAYAYLDKTKNRVIGLKGDKEQKFLVEGVDAATFKHGIERKQDYILKVGLLKDKLASYMTLNWNRGEESQPSNFMNFPQPNDGLYTLESYFSHYESENRNPVVNRDGSTSYRWEKVNSAVNNHFFDCAVYNIALRDIIVDMYASLKPELKHSQWRDYVKHVLS